MAVALPPLPVFAELLALPPLPRIRTHPLQDRAADPGLFGPGSATWELFDAPFLILGGGRALLMQIAHPLIAEGVIDHSDFVGDPFGRLLNTARWAMAISFGTRDEALQATAIVNRRHHPVRGRLSEANATSRVGKSTAYSAKDAALALWVHATLVDSFLISRRALRGAIKPELADRFVREWNEVALLMGIPRSELWHSRAQLSAYINSSIDDGPVHVGAGSRLVANTILDGPFPKGPLRQSWKLIRLFSVAELSPTLRRQFGIGWTNSQALAYAMATAVIRSQKLLPPALRDPAILRFARNRCRV